MNTTLIPPIIARYLRNTYNWIQRTYKVSWKWQANFIHNLAYNYYNRTQNCKYKSPNFLIIEISTIYMGTIKVWILTAKTQLIGVFQNKINLKSNFSLAFYHKFRVWSLKWMKYLPYKLALLFELERETIKALKNQNFYYFNTTHTFPIISM